MAADYCEIGQETKVRFGNFGFINQVTKDGKLYAIKHLVSDTGQFNLNSTEIDILFRIGHPNLLRGIQFVSETGCDRSRLGVLLPLAIADLSQVSQLGNYTILHKLNHLINILDGLAVLHMFNILHLDIYPGAILMFGKAVTGSIVLGGFDSAIYVSNITTNTKIDTSLRQGYRPPEKSVNYATDIYMLGMTFKQIISTDELHQVTNKNKPNMAPNHNLGLLLDMMTDPNPNKRPNAIQIRNILTSFIPVEAKPVHIATVPHFPPDIHPRVEKVVGYALSAMKEWFSNLSVETLFLAADLAYRSAGSIEDTSDTNAMLAVACCLIAVDIFNHYLAMDLIFDSLSKLYPNATGITREGIIDMIYHVYVYNRGVLYRDYLYHGAKSGTQFINMYTDIISNKDIYYQIDIAGYVNNLPNDKTSKIMRIDSFL